MIPEKTTLFGIEMFLRMHADYISILKIDSVLISQLPDDEKAISVQTIVSEAMSKNERNHK